MLTGTDFIRTTFVGGLGPERPRSVGIDPIQYSVDVEAVRLAVAVEYVNLEAVAGVGIDHRAGDAVMIRGLVDVGQHDLVWLWYQVRRVKMLAVD